MEAAWVSESGLFKLLLLELEKSAGITIRDSCRAPRSQNCHKCTLWELEARTTGAAHPKTPTFLGSLPHSHVHHPEA